MTFRPSVFLKLLVVYGLTFLVIVFGLGILLFGPAAPRVELFQDNLRHYADLLASEIGHPPDLARAQTLRDNLGLEVTIEGPGIRWSTNPELLRRLPFSRDAAALNQPPGALLWGQSLLVSRIGTTTYGFSLTRTARQGSSLAMLMGLLFLAAVLVSSWLVVRRLLRPLKDMKEVARTLGDAGWKARVTVRGRDELAELGTTLNGMADRIEQYVVSMHRLMAGVSHELRSPLTRMKVALELVSDQRIKDSLAEEITLLDRMTGILLERERLRTRPDALRYTRVEITAWLTTVAAPYRAAGLVVALEGPSLEVAMDSERMTMAVRNLLENVTRHAPGSPAVLRWRRSERPGRSLVLCCQDQGPGLASEEVAHLGEPFFLADRSRTGNRTTGGYGLGFSLVVSILEAHGGTVTVENAQPPGLLVILEW